MSNNRQVTAGIMYTFRPDGSDYVAIRIIPTGWTDQYHVIIEDALYGAKTFPEPLYRKDIEVKYNIVLPEEMLRLDQLVKDTPNDYSLGETLRQHVRLLNN